MPAFGRDQMLPRDEILNVTAYVQSLSDPTVATGQHAEAVRAGQETFAVVSRVTAGGWERAELGAPDLTDRLWLYGGDRQSIFATIYHGRQGHMPNWEQRLTPLDRKILVLYVLDLGSVPMTVFEERGRSASREPGVRAASFSPV